MGTRKFSMPLGNQLGISFLKAKTLIGVIAVSVFSLFVSCNAHAAIDEAIEAFKNQDGAAMLAEVKEAAKQKNDDGVILFLILLKEYPQSWRPVLAPTQQDELFALLEKLAEESSLQAQYRLAIVPREHVEPPYNSPEARKQEQTLIRRLEAVANKGYSYAAFDLYVIASNTRPPHYNPHTTMKWLIKSAELGHTVGAFILGMKYLNIEDFYYGCPPRQPERCLQKDEAKGWYWMQQAAMRVDKYDFIWADLAYQMGNLYRTGVDGQQQDFLQAYLWYQTATQGLGAYLKLPKIRSALEEMRSSGQLDQVAKTRKQTSLNFNSISDKPRLLGIYSGNYEEPRPVFSFASISWFKSSQLLELYPDGRVTLLVTPEWWQDLKSNTETWKKVSPGEIKEFMQTLEGLAFQDGGYLMICDHNDCMETTHNLITVQEDEERHSALLINQRYEVYLPNLAQVIAHIEKYFSMREFLCAASNSKDEKHCLPIEEISKSLID
jgi:hypothetical protein